MIRPAWALTIFRKEWIDALRDRRTILLTFVTAIIAGPMMIVLIVNMIAGQREKARELGLPVAGAGNAPALVAFLERRQVQIRPAPADIGKAVRAGDVDVVLEIPPEFAEQAASGRRARVLLHYDRSRDRAQAAIAETERLLDAYDRQWGDARLLMRGVAPELTRPLSADRLNYSTPQQSGSLILFMVAYYGLFSALIGGMAISLDTTAGERERGSLEPLLATPTTALEIAVGKWLAVAAVTAIVVVLTLAGFYVTLRFAPLPAIGVPFLFGMQELGRFLAVLWPVVLMVPAVQLALACRGRTFKEAQTNMQLLLFLVSLLPLLQFFMQRREPAWLVAVPVNGQYSLLSRVLRGDAIAPADWLLNAAIPIAVTALALAFLARTLSREALTTSR